MPTRNRPAARLSRPARAGSWMALLAATTFGDAADTLHAEVRAEGLVDSDSYRLVVQSYDSRPNGRSKPVGSLQRAVTADELRHGVHVNLLELRHTAEAAGDQQPMVVAWVEAGQPDLEFDARRARPLPGSVYGAVRRDANTHSIQISLSRKVAA